MDSLIRDCGVKSSSLILIVIFSTFLTAMPAFGTTYYVAASGSDANPGTESDPWQTIQKAADTLVAGDTVYIRVGTYNERVVPENSGSAGNYITYAAYPGETVTIDGTGVDLPEWTALFDITGKAYIKVSGLRVMNAKANPHNLGIQSDTSSHVIIEKNYVYNTNDSGIGIWSSSDVIVYHNEIENPCQAGWNESLSVGGTDGFEASYNLVHDSVKEGICIKDGSANGKVYGNQVHHTQAVGIYIDAEAKHTYNIKVFQNIVHDSSDGIGVGSETGGLLENVKIYNNISYNNSFLGINIHRYGVASVQVQPLHQIEVINNTVYNNGLSGWGGCISVSNPDVQDIVIRNNICSQNLSFQIVVLTAALPQGLITVDHNLIDGFREYIDEGAMEIRGSDYVEGDTKFVNASKADFHLQQDSPAIDAGSSSNAPSDDFDGNPRPYGSGYDIGTYEYGATSTNLNPNPPNHPVRLIFIHHSTGENWLNDENGGLGIELRDNNYYVSDTNYGWGPTYPDKSSTIGDHTDIGNWWEWFRGSNSSNYLNALYNESEQHSPYSRFSTAPSGENEVIMFKSCFPNSALQGNPNDPVPSIDSNLLKGVGSGSEYHTVANAKGIYIDLLEYFGTRQDKLFIVITAPPLMVGDTNTTEAANARAINNWLVNQWLVSYPYNNVFVFDFYNVLTSNGDNPNTNDLGSETGNHHRWWNGAIQHIQTVNKNVAAYPSGDSHPSQAGNLKATGEFLPLLNVVYHLWKVEVVETVSTPSTPSGSASGIAGASCIYSTDGAVSSLGHSVQYNFDWGDGTESGWLAVGTTSASKSWSTPGAKSVKAKARCSGDTSVESGWSAILSVNISATPSITLIAPSDGQTFTACSYYDLPTFGWNASGTFKTIELQFSTQNDFAASLVKVKGSITSSSLTMKSSTWKKILLLPGTSGGTVFWKVVGTLTDKAKTKVESSVSSLLIGEPQAVGNPQLSHYNRTATPPPTISWLNNCNIKFKAWFGSDSNFTKKKSFSFTDSAPTDNGGLFSKELSSSQWSSIRKLVGDASGATIHWYVESWDALKRRSTTSVMIFVLE